MTPETIKEIKSFLNKPEIRECIMQGDLNTVYEEFYAHTLFSRNTLTEYLILHSINPLDYFNSKIPKGSFAYNEAENFKHLHISNPCITIIGSSAFENCLNLEELTFSEDSNVEIIEIAAFAMCPYLNHVVLPKSLITIERNAFADCPNLGYVEFNSIAAIDNIGHAVFNGADTHSFEVKIPAGSLPNLNRKYKEFSYATTIFIMQDRSQVALDDIEYSFTVLENLERIIFKDEEINRDQVLT